MLRVCAVSMGGRGAQLAIYAIISRRHQEQTAHAGGEMSLVRGVIE